MVNFDEINYLHLINTQMPKKIIATGEPERRKSPDILVNLARILVVLSWLTFIVALIVSFYAAPEEEYGLLRFHEIEVRQTWLMPLTNYLYGILWFSAASSFFCLILTAFRSRRKHDSKQFNIILLLVTIFSWVIYIFISTSTY